MTATGTTWRRCGGVRAGPDDDFAAGRGAVLSDLLAKPTLFHTAYAREHWKAPPAGNVARELARLGSVSRGG